MYQGLLKQRDELRSEFERMSMTGSEMALRSKGIESQVLTKVLRYIRSDKYETE